MTNANEFGVGLAHEFAITAAKVGWKPKDMAELAHNADLMQQVLYTIKGTHEIRQKERIVIDAFREITRTSLRFYRHISYDRSFVLNIDDIIFYTNPVQGSEKGMNGELLEQVIYSLGEKACSSPILEFLLKHQHLIPKQWKLIPARTILFWGTIYRYDTNCIKVVTGMRFDEELERWMYVERETSDVFHTKNFKEDEVAAIFK